MTTNMTASVWLWLGIHGLLLVVAQSGSQTAFAPPEAAVLPELAPHPRLLATQGDIDRLKGALAADTTAQAYYRQLEAFGEQILGDPSNSTNVGKDQG